MAIQKILTVPNLILRQKSKPVEKIDKKINNLVKDLIDTTKAAKEPKGVGLSAIQIGKLVRVFVIKQDKKFIPFIHPKIIWSSKKTLSRVLPKKQQFLEGCLSIPTYYGFVDRSWGVKLEWQSLQGKIHKEKFKDKQSAYVQHEVDHLDGILFIDRILAQKARLPSPGAKATGGQGKLYKLGRKKVFIEIKLP